MVHATMGLAPAMVVGREQIVPSKNVPMSVLVMENVLEEAVCATTFMVATIAANPSVKTTAMDVGTVQTELVTVQVDLGEKHAKFYCAQIIVL